MMGEWNIKCSGCKKMLPITDYKDVDCGYGVYRKSSCCKACNSLMDKKRWEYNKKWLAFQKKVHGIKPNLQTEEYRKEEMKKLAYPFGWARI